MPSLTIQGVVLLFLTGLDSILGLQVAPGELDVFVKVGFLIFSGLLAWYGRWRLGDISVLGFRK